MAVAVTGVERAEAFIKSDHHLLIDGEWVESQSGETFATLNPATEEVLTEVAHGMAADIDLAVKAARKAFDDDSEWRRMNASDRGRLIWRISELIEDNAVCAIPFSGDPNVFTREAHKTANRLRAGTVWINTYHVFDAAMPFGGYKESGWGREMGSSSVSSCVLSSSDLRRRYGYLETKSVVTAL